MKLAKLLAVPTIAAVAVAAALSASGPGAPAALPDGAMPIASCEPTAPEILVEPQDAMADVGGTATFSVVATGDSPLTYQWKKNSVDIDGAGEASYTTPEIVPGDDGTFFSVVVTNPAGQTVSRQALLRLRPAISVTPAAVAQSVAGGDCADDQLTVANGGNGQLDWTATLAGAGFKAFDSGTAGGPSYAWTDISGTGTAIAGMGDETVSDPIDLGFAFPFYGGSFTSVRVCSNGYLSFTSSSCQYDNLELPGTSAPANLVAPLWDDLDPSAGGTIYCQQTDANTFVVQFEAVRFAGSELTATFQAILKSDGTIAFQYKALGRANTVTAGVQDESRTRGLELVCNGAYLANEMAVKLYPSTSWLYFAPDFGQIMAGGCDLRVDLALNAGSLPLGTYEEVLRFSSNDPEHPTVDVPVTMTVTAADRPPVIAEGDVTAVTMSEDGSPTPFDLTLHATDADGDTLTWSVSGAASHGTASAEGTGSSKAIGYTPEAGYSGCDSFVVTVSDGNGGSDTIVVSVTIYSNNAPPEISSYSPDALFGMAAGSSQVFEIWATDPEDDPLVYSWKLDNVGTGATGSAFTYSPAEGDAGSHLLEVTVSDGNGGSAIMAWAVTVTSTEPDPAIELSTATLTASCKRGACPAAGSFTVKNSGGGTLSYTSSGSAGWLSCSPASGSSDGEADPIAVGYNASSLAAGTYVGTIAVEAPGAASQTVTVTLTVTESDEGGGGGGGGGGCSLADTELAGPAGAIGWLLPWLAVTATWLTGRRRRVRGESRSW